MSVNLAICLVLISLTTIGLATVDLTVPVSETTKAIYHGSSKDKVALMFNVYDGTEHLLAIVDIFEKYDLKTTFFVGGVWARRNADTLSSIASKGFEIGSHGYFHKDHSKCNYRENYREISASKELMEGIIGHKITLFAPPSGAYNNDTIAACVELNLNVIMWSRDTIDWRDHDSDLIYRRATSDMAGGDLILMHPTQETVNALPEILDYCIQHELTPSTVTETLN